MEDGDAPVDRPADADFGRDRLETGDDGCVVRLVGPGARLRRDPYGVVADDTAEQDDGAAARAHRPRVRLRRRAARRRSAPASRHWSRAGARPHRSPGRRRDHPGVTTSSGRVASLLCGPVDRAHSAPRASVAPSVGARPTGPGADVDERPGHHRHDGDAQPAADRAARDLDDPEHGAEPQAVLLSCSHSVSRNCGTPSRCLAPSGPGSLSTASRTITLSIVLSSSLILISCCGAQLKLPPVHSVRSPVWFDAADLSLPNE